jgi:hypothetical protein
MIETVTMSGLVVCCPVVQGNPPDCPLHEIRKLPLRERYVWLRHRSAREISSILHEHFGCPRCLRRDT